MLGLGPGVYVYNWAVLSDEQMSNKVWVKHNHIIFAKLLFIPTIQETNLQVLWSGQHLSSRQLNLCIVYIGYYSTLFHRDDDHL